MIFGIIFIGAAILLWVLYFYLLKAQKKDPFANGKAGIGKIYTVDYPGALTYYVTFTDQFGHTWKERCMSVKKNGHVFEVGEEVPILYDFIKDGSSVIVKINHPLAPENDANMASIALVFAIMMTIAGILGLIH